MFLVDGGAVLGLGHELVGAVDVGVRRRFRAGRAGGGGAAREGSFDFFAEGHFDWGGGRLVFYGLRGRWRWCLEGWRDGCRGDGVKAP